MTPAVGQQTDPTTGAGMMVGSLSGAVMMNNDFSSMMWIPSASSLAIGNTTYDFIFNASGPAANRGYAIAVNNVGTPTSIQAVVATSAVPEPATLVMLGTGLLVLAGLARVSGRRQRVLPQPVIPQGEALSGPAIPARWPATM